MFERNFDNQLEELKKLTLVMGGHVEKALAETTQALITRSPDRFKEVHEIEVKINEHQKNIDSLCLSLLAKQGPVAKDLRLILSIIKINTDLERMGDQSVNIAYTGKDYLSRAPIHQLSDIEKMSEVARLMVKESLDSFVRGDIELAKTTLLRDDELDHLKNKVYNELVAFIKQNPQEVEASLDLILIARNLERLGDHATNIAEDVIFAFTGKDIRHGGGE